MGSECQGSNLAHLSSCVPLGKLCNISRPYAALVMSVPLLRAVGWCPGSGRHAALTRLGRVRLCWKRSGQCLGTTRSKRHPKMSQVWMNREWLCHQGETRVVCAAASPGMGAAGPAGLCVGPLCSELRAGERSEAEHSALWPHRGAPGRLQARGAASPPRSSRLAVGTSAGSSALPPPCSGWFFLGRLLGRRPEPSRGGST